MVTSPQFAELWDAVARTAHSGFEALLTGGDSPFLTSENGQVAVQLDPVVVAVTDEIANRGINGTLPEENLQYVLFESQTLGDIQSGVEFIDELALILPVVALLTQAGFIVLSPNRRGASLVAALGMAVMMAVVLLVLILGRRFYLKALDDTVEKDAARAMFDTLTHYLRRALRVIGLFGLLVASLADGTQSRN